MAVCRWKPVIGWRKDFERFHSKCLLDATRQALVIAFDVLPPHAALSPAPARIVVRRVGACSGARRVTNWHEGKNEVEVALRFLGWFYRVDLKKPVSNIRSSVCPQNVSSISIKFGMYVEVDEWCTTVCSMARSKVKVKVTSLS